MNHRVKQFRVPASEAVRGIDGAGARVVQADVDPVSGDLVLVIHSPDFPEWDPSTGPVPTGEAPSAPPVQPPPAEA